MDVTTAAAIGTGIQNAELGNKIGVAVARKTLDAAEQQGAALIAMLEKAAHVGGAEPGKGANLDVVG